MDLLKAFIIRFFCIHDYEFRARYLKVKNQKVGCYEDYKCLKCGKRKECKA